MFPYVDGKRKTRTDMYSYAEQANRVIGSSGHRVIGSSGHRVIGSSGHRIIGSSDHRIIGASGGVKRTRNSENKTGLRRRSSCGISAEAWEIYAPSGFVLCTPYFGCKPPTK